LCNEKTSTKFLIAFSDHFVGTTNANHPKIAHYKRKLSKSDKKECEEGEDEEKDKDEEDKDEEDKEKEKEKGNNQDGIYKKMSDFCIEVILSLYNTLQEEKNYSKKSLTKTFSDFRNGINEKEIEETGINCCSDLPSLDWSGEQFIKENEELIKNYPFFKSNKQQEVKKWKEGLEKSNVQQKNSNKINNINNSNNNNINNRNNNINEIHNKIAEPFILKNFPLGLLRDEKEQNYYTFASRAKAIFKNNKEKYGELFREEENIEEGNTYAVLINNSNAAPNPNFK